MKVSELIERLKQFPQHLPVQVYLEPSMFPDGVNLNDIPGWYVIEGVDYDNIPRSGNVVTINIDWDVPADDLEGKPE